MENVPTTPLNIFERLNQWIQESIMVKLVSIGFLILILLIPSSGIQNLIEERQQRSDEVVRRIEQVLHVVFAGLADAVKGRREFQREFEVEATRILDWAPNPIKHAETAGEIASLLLDPVRLGRPTTSQASTRETSRPHCASRLPGGIAVALGAPGSFQRKRNTAFFWLSKYSTLTGYDCPAWRRTTGLVSVVAG